MIHKCPHCQSSIEVSDLWEFFECPSCSASLQIEGEKIKLIKAPDLDSSAPTSVKSLGSVNEKLGDIEQEPENAFSSAPENLENETNLDEKEDSSEGFTQVQSQFNQEFDASGSFSGSSQQFSSVGESKNGSENVDADLGSRSFSGSSRQFSSIGESQNKRENSAILYGLEILFSEETEVQIRQVLEDKRLNLNIDELFSQISEDGLKISKLNPVKVLYLIRRLSHLPVSVKWVQEK